MPLWIALFAACLVLFESVVLIWNRIEAARAQRKQMASLRPGFVTDDQTPAGRPLIEPLEPKRGLRTLFASRLHAAGRVFWQDPRLVLATIVMAAAGFVLGIQLNPIMGPPARVIGAGLAGALPGLSQKRKERKRLMAIEEQMPDALDFLGRSIRAGNAFSVGLELLADEVTDPLRPEIQKMTREMYLGARMEDAFQGLIDRVPLLEIRFFAAAVLLQRETGGNLSEVLAKLSLAVRERLRLRGHVKAASGQGRLTAAILTVLPMATLCALQIISPGYLGGLTNEPVGRNLLSAGAVSIITGYIVMQKIVRIEV